jgi:hypothetical protein
MNDSELDKKLMAARGPALDQDYTEDFPRVVLANLNSVPGPAVPRRRPWLPRLAWGLATAGCVVVAFIVGHRHGQMEAGQDVLANARLVQGTLAMFPNRVRAIVRDEHGLNLVLSDQDNVPASTPIYVQICDGEHCSSLVTFSGQEIQIAGQEITVLSDASGGIILEGNEFVWSSANENQASRGLKIQAKLL